MSESTQITDMAIELARPWMLWCLLALVPIAWYFWKSLSDFPTWQRRVSLVARVLIVGCLVLALAGLTLLQPTKKMFVVLAVDRSQSVDAEASGKIDEYIKQTAEARGTNDLAVIDFAAEPAAMSAFDAERTSQPENAKRATNIASAIESAVASVPPSHVPHVVVLSDGRQTLGDAVQAAAGAKVPISTVPLPSRDEPEVQVAEVTAPAQVRQGEPFYVEVTIASNHADQGFIDVYRGDVLAIEQKEPIKIEEGETKLRFRQTVDDEKQVDYAVRVRGFH